MESLWIGRCQNLTVRKLERDNEETVKIQKCQNLEGVNSPIFFKRKKIRQLRYFRYILSSQPFIEPVYGHYLKMPLKQVVLVQNVLPLVQESIEVPPGQPQGLGHGRVDLGPRPLLLHDEVVSLPQQVLDRRLLPLEVLDDLQVRGLEVGGLGEIGAQVVDAGLQFQDLGF